jgi:hypothetical protein
MADNFWTDSLAPSTKDPKRQYRFTVKLLNYDGGAQWYAKSITKPSFTVTDTSHTYLNHKFYYPGRVEWGEISVTLVDPVSPDAAAETFAIIEAAGYHIPGDENDTTTMSKTRAVSALGSVVINQIDSEGNSLEEWVLNNAFIKSVNLGDLNYESDGLSTITLGIRYDWATCSTSVPANIALGESGLRPSGAPGDSFFRPPNTK